MYLRAQDLRIARGLPDRVGNREIYLIKSVRRD